MIPAPTPPPGPPPPWSPRIWREPVVDSTNRLAADLLASGRADAPLAVRADRQTAGRGRGANLWWSDSGSLTFTLAVAPASHGLRPDHEPRLALAAALAVIEAAGVLIGGGRTIGIRWPNDIEADGRKLGGILPERVETARGPRVLIGIGLNVATQLDDAPEDVQRMATSLEGVAGRPLGVDAIDAAFEAILSAMPGVLRALAGDDPALVESWNALDTLLGVEVGVDLGGRVVRGLGAGIEADGGLRLVADGRLTTLHGGRVLRNS